MRRSILRLAVGTACAVAVLPLPAHAATAMPSAIGDEAVQWLTVSPAYGHTGLVIAVAQQMSGCQSSCTRLWATHDGGATWTELAARGWAGGRPVVAIDGQGREVLVAASSSALQESTDGGESWSTVANAGTTLPAISPQFATTGEVAVANPSGGDVRYTPAGAAGVRGSGGAATDLAFAYSPSYPSAGGHAAALLSSADPKSGLPVISTCDASLSCTGAATLPGATTYSAPATLLPSPGFASDGVVFAQSGRGIYKSTDGGLSFAPLPVAPANGATATATPMLALAPGYREAGPVRTLYAAVFQVFTDPRNPHSAGGVYRSTDGGATWQGLGLSTPLSNGVMAVATAPDGRLFAGYVASSGAGLLCSQDGGTTWVTACTRLGTTRAASGTAAQTASHPATAAAPSCTSACAASPASAGVGGTSTGAHAVAVSAAPASARGGSAGVPVGLLLIAVVLLTAAAGGVVLYRRGTRPA